MKTVDVKAFAERVVTQYQIVCDECGCGLTTDGGTLEAAVQGFISSGYNLVDEVDDDCVLCDRCVKSIANVYSLSL